jgi:hypothetical protein
MSFRAYVLRVSVVALLLYAGCKENPTEPVTVASTIYGKVTRYQTNDTIRIIGATIADQGTIQKTALSDSMGNFSLPLGVLTATYNTTLITTKTGYYPDTATTSVEVGKDQTVTIRLKIQDSSIVTNTSGGPNSIELLDPSKSHVIALKGNGNPESIVLTFVVKDSSGRPIVAPNQYWVNFVLISTSPSGGAFLLPDSARTNPLNGQVSVTVCSGTNPTVLQIYASIRGTRAITSPVVIGVGGGFADPARVSIGATKLNIAGRVYGNLRTTVTLSASDRYGSPVFQNTPVQFQCNYGKLSEQQGLAFTDKEGNAVIDLISTTNPPPTGLVTITATTSGDSSISIARSMQILFSGHTKTPGRAANAANFTVPDGQTNYFDIKVSDDLGYPLIEGSTVKITLYAADTLMKDLQLLFGNNGVYTFLDRQDTNATNLRVSVMDKGTSKITGYITFGIEITSTNGDYSNPNWFTGYVSGGSSGNFNVPASIELADSSVNFLYLRETGLPGTTRRLNFVVKDALGNVIQSPTKARVDFSFLQAPNGTTLSKTQDSTNSSGRVFVDIAAGDTAGIAIVSATTLDMANGTLTSAFSLPIEIAHGLPDSNKVFIELSKTNMFNKSGYQVGTINLSLSDIYGSYAAPQKAFSDITVTTSGGYVNSVPLTVGGKASVGLFGSSSEPNDPILGPGFGYVRAVVVVHGGGVTTKSAPFLFSYAPKIAITSTSVVDTAAGALQRSLADGGMEEIQFTVADKNGNPISSGNSINVSVSGDVASEINVTGDVNLTLPETWDRSATNYRFTIHDNTSNGGSQGKFRVTIKVSGESGTAIKTIDGYLLAPGVLGGSTSGYAKSIILVDPLAKRSIYVQGSGGAGTGRPTTTTLEFIALDSLNRPVDANHAVLMQFGFQGETFGATIQRNSGLTDAAGSFTTVVESGSHSGVPYVLAYAIVNGDTIKSGLVQILVSSGFADPSRFSVAAEKLNFPGMQWDGLIDIIRVQPGDRFGNPVPQNTPVWFYCAHGVVQTENAYTDINGIINQNYYSNGTRPRAEATGDHRFPGETDGFTYVKARTMGEAGQDIWDSLRVLWTGSPFYPFNSPGANPYSPLSWTVSYTDTNGVTTNLSGPNSPTVPHLGTGGSWHFQIRDYWGNPMSAGTAITVDGGSAVKVVGDISINLPDTQFGANGVTAWGITDFSVAINDAHAPTDPPEKRSYILVVKVVHPIYGESDFILASGTVF